MNGSEISGSDAGRDERHEQGHERKHDRHAGDHKADGVIAGATVRAGAEEAVVSIPLKVFACRHCAATYFPGRSLCAACGRGDFVEVDGAQGWIEQWTELHQSLSQQQSQQQPYQQRSGEPVSEQQPRHYLATVRTAAGPRVIAAMAEAGEAGIAVTLWHEGERLIARRKASV